MNVLYTLLIDHKMQLSSHAGVRTATVADSGLVWGASMPLWLIVYHYVSHRFLTQSHGVGL